MHRRSAQRHARADARHGRSCALPCIYDPIYRRNELGADYFDGLISSKTLVE